MSCSEECLNLSYDLIWTRIPETIRIDDLLTIDVDAELTKPTLYRLDRYVICLLQPGRHTGGLHLLDRSNRTVVDHHFDHAFNLLFGAVRATPYKCCAQIQ